LQELDVIRHIVMWKLKPGANEAQTQAQREEVVALLNSVKQCVPGIIEFEIGTAQPGLEADADVILNSLFEDKATMQAYHVHPDHQAILGRMKELRETRHCMDYVVNA